MNMQRKICFAEKYVRFCVNAFDKILGCCIKIGEFIDKMLSPIKPYYHRYKDWALSLENGFLSWVMYDVVGGFVPLVLGILLAVFVLVKAPAIVSGIFLVFSYVFLGMIFLIMFMFFFWLVAVNYMDFLEERGRK